MSSDKKGSRGARGVRLNPKHDERTRAKIQTSQIVNRLFSFVNGEAEMSAPQVTAALGLLKKTLPDLSAVDLKAELNDKRTNADWTRDELVSFLANAANSSSGASEEDGRDRASDSVH